MSDAAATPPSLTPADFAVLGAFAEAGLRATELALARAARSAAQGRVPIAGAAVLREADGTLATVAVGNNGRIPAPEDAGPGYPTDHGETATIRQVPDVAAVDWSRVVFTTTLSPCIMCTRTLIHLYHLGLTRIVIAEAKSFPGHKEMLARLPGMTLVELTNAGAVEMMGRFARAYPWDWAADIGEVPPGDLGPVTGLVRDPGQQRRLLQAVAGIAGTGPKCGVVSGTGVVLAGGVDQRQGRGGNPTLSAPMIAMGEAGSTVNLRGCALVFVAPDDAPVVTLDAFGDSSLGACELFRPAALLSNAPVADDLTMALTTAGIVVVTAPGLRPSKEGQP